MEVEENILRTYEVSVNKKVHSVKLMKKDEAFFFAEVNGKNVEVRMLKFNDEKRVFLQINGKTVQAEIINVSGSLRQVRIDGKIFDVQFPTVSFKPEAMNFESIAAPSFKKQALSLGSVKDAVLAPIAGRIVALKVGVGQRVSKGDCICILEAMKMANEVAAHKEGVVKEIVVSEGSIVNKGDVLCIIA